MSELKPCPFCGGEARLFVSENGVCVKCTNGFTKGCGCQTDWFTDSNYVDGMEGWRKTKFPAVDKAIVSWNRRAE